MLQHAQLVAARHDADAALFDGCIIKVNHASDHAVVVVGKEGRILVHGKGRSLFRRLDKELVVMQLDILGAKNAGSDGGKALIADQPGERRRVKLDIVTVINGRLFGIVRGLACGAPSGVQAGVCREAVDDVVCLLTEVCRLRFGKDPFDK